LQSLLQQLRLFLHATNGPRVEPWDLTVDLKSHLQTLYTQSLRITLASSVSLLVMLPLLCSSSSDTFGMVLEHFPYKKRKRVKERTGEEMFLMSNQKREVKDTIAMWYQAACLLVVEDYIFSFS
jgi:hypothetical protein